MGVSIGKNTIIDEAHFTWYHKVKIGRGCTIEKNVFFKYDDPFTEGYAIVIDDKTFVGNGCEFDILERITIGYYCAVASGSVVNKFIVQYEIWGSIIARRLGERPYGSAVKETL